MLKWLKETISNSQTGTSSAKRVVLLMAAACLSLATLILAIAAVNGIHIDAALMGTITAPLAGLAGYGYVNGKAVEKKGEVDDKPSS